MQSRGTLATSIYGALRRDILRGVFRPGEKLRIDALVVRYEVGATPLREALNRLSSEDLVLRVDQRGFRVAPLSLDDLAELTKTLCWISERGLREAIEHGDAGWEDGIVLAAHHLSRVPREGAEGHRSFNPEWERLHRDLHLAMLQACGSRWLLDFYALLVDRHDRYKYLAAAGAVDRRDTGAEHRRIVEAVLARDTERAVALMNDHIRLTGEIVMRSHRPHLMDGVAVAGVAVAGAAVDGVAGSPSRSSDSSRTQRSHHA
jgi:GntR family transcriptional regulator, carbon starvation induced regulator